jgi:PadR family transcriptional regulator PadR
MTKQEMREPTFLVLSALASGRMHGYALLAETESLSQGRVQMKPGTLYAVLDRLREEGLVEPAGEQIVDGRLRRYYEITDEGANRLAAEAARLEANARRAMANLGTRAAGLTA